MHTSVRKFVTVPHGIRELLNYAGTLLAVSSRRERKSEVGRFPIL